MSNKMHAVIWERYGPPEVLKIGEVDKPKPRDNEILVRVYGASVTPGDCELRSFQLPYWWFWLPLRLYFGLFTPRGKRLGMEYSGVVEEQGSSVTRFQPGDEVFGGTGASFGAYSEYITVREDSAVAIKPSGMSHEEAATVNTGGTNGLHFLRKANIKPGQTILINGAGGTIGSYAVQLALHFGAVVTAVDAADKLNMLRDVGVERVVDYKKIDFTREGVKYDIVFDVAGKASYTGCLKCLKPGGILLLSNPGLSHMLRAPLTNMTSSKTVIFQFASETAEDLQFLGSLLQSGTIKAIVDRTFSITHIAEAHRYVESGAKVGNVAISGFAPVAD